MRCYIHFFIYRTMKINIGNREFKTITQSELYELLKIDGICQNEGMMINHELLRPWHNHIIIESHWVDFTFWFSGTQTRIKDDYQVTFEGYVDFEDFIVLYSNSVRNTAYIDRLRLKSLNWLIEKGFNLPLSSYSN